MVCLQEDDFVFEKCRWIAHLSNGQKVIQDDGRPQADPPQAWLRLATYCETNQLNITNVTLQFRSHHQSPLPADAEGYYFINKVASINYGETLGFYLIGYLKMISYKFSNGKFQSYYWLEKKSGMQKGRVLNFNLGEIVGYNQF